MFFTTADIDLDRFQQLCEVLIAPHLTRTEPVRRWRNHNNKVLIELPIKTFRCSWGSPDDCSGTASPNAIAYQAAQDLAHDLGLKVKWEPLEKGWGAFYFENHE